MLVKFLSSNAKKIILKKWLRNFDLTFFPFLQGIFMPEMKAYCFCHFCFAQL